MIFFIVFLSFESSKGRLPINIAYNIQPIAHISKAGEALTFLLRNISGGKYYIEPALVISDFLPAYNPEIPKSTIFISLDSLFTFKIFSSFKSL